jgi:hypothetical protein
MFFYLTLIFAWWLTKILWGNKTANYSLFVLIPIGLFMFPIMWNDTGRGIFSASFMFAFVFAVIFVAINSIVMFIGFFITADWKNPEVQRAFISGMLGTRSNKSFTLSSDNEYATYLIQYRNQVGTSWINGPSSNDEHIAESMFDQFITNNPHGNRRCRLVKKVNGRVVAVLGTN